MRQSCLFVIILMGMHLVNAQTACPIAGTSLTWSNQSATSLGLSSFSSVVTITGDFTVDTSVFTFSMAEVGFKAGCSIIVLSGCELRVLSSTLTNLGTEMWEGISVQPGGSLVVDDAAICGAVTGVKINNAFSSSAASFDIRNSLFRYNYSGMEVSNYSVGTYPGYITGTHFQGGPLASTTCLGIAPPLPNSYRGIYVSQVSGGTGLTIGDATTAPAAANQFTDLDLGIEALSSTVRVFNNEFDDIQDIAGLNKGYAVYASVNPPGPYELIVGSSSTRSNSMTDCRFGVYSTGMQIVNISDNTMTAGSGPFEIGVEIKRTSDSIIVSENTISDFTNTGVILDENPGPGGGLVDASVNTNMITGTFDESVGVWVNLLEGGVNVRINEISQVFRGIVAQSLAGASQVQIDTNTISFGYAGVSTQPATGILALDVAMPEIFKNIITGNCPYPGGGGPCSSINLNNSRIRGIVLYSTTDAQIYLNYVEHSGAGLYVLRDNLEGNAICNEFHDSYSGVVWDNVDTAEFGRTFGSTNRVYGLVTSTTSSDNRWTSTVGGGFEPVRSFSINGAQAATIDWYYRNAATYDFPGGGTNLNIIPATKLDTVIGATSTICDILLAAFRDGRVLAEQSLEQPSPWREDALNRALDNGSESSISRTLYQYLCWAYQHDVTDPDLQAVLGWTNIPALDSIAQHWQQGDLETAKNITDRLSPINTEETFFRDVWRIRLERELDAVRTGWTNEELNILLGIAQAPLEEAGSAALFAQSLLGLTLLPDEWAVFLVEERRGSEQVQRPLLVPNPAGKDAFLLYAEAYQYMQITDIQGRIVMSLNLDNQSSQRIDLQNLPSGSYVVQLIHKTGQQLTLKFQVNR